MGAVTVRPLRVRWAGAAVGLLGLGVALSGCGHRGPSSAPSTTSAAQPTTSTGPPATSPPAPTTTAPPATAPPTTVWRPAAPQASPEAAAAALVGAWEVGNRTTAATVATPEAVTTLFAVPYPGAGLAIPRGCSAAFPPIVCTYGPPGGASPNDAIYELKVSPILRGWYVSSVQILS
jgi:hypothetical protein